MIPILLHSHTRALTKIIYNADGDLLFSASKDHSPTVWFSHNGERLGTMRGHSGSIWSLSVSQDSRTLATGSADNSLRLWDVATGKAKGVLETKTAVRGVHINAQAEHLLALITDSTMGHKSIVGLYDTRSGSVVRSKDWAEKATKPTVVTFTSAGDVITGHDDGRLIRWDVSKDEVNVVIESAKGHSDTIRDIQWSRDGTYFITASKDTTAKLFDAETLTARKVYKTERPVNAAAISPLRNEVVLAGGQEALQVTTTSSRAGQFEARFFDQVYEAELGRVRGHFGPINTLAYHPSGRGYASGAEDGYIRLHVFDPDYYALQTCPVA